MKKVFSLLIIILVVLICVRNIHKTSIREATQAGYDAGYAEAYKKTMKEYSSRFDEQTSLFEKELKLMEKNYTIKISKAEEDGLYNGKKDQLEIVTQKVEEKASKAKKAKKWNEILYEVQ